MMSYFIGGIITGIFISAMVAFVIWAYCAAKADKKFFAGLSASIADINAQSAAMEARNAERRAQLGLSPATT